MGDAAVGRGPAVAEFDGDDGTTPATFRGLLNLTGGEFRRTRGAGPLDEEEAPPPPTMVV